ncbi:MAG: hypothetical protein IMZ54_11410 [Acidobacteria bacterium]|nr:hypothetical protein [Acidobacteriota bacterium]
MIDKNRKAAIGAGVPSLALTGPLLGVALQVSMAALPADAGSLRSIGTAMLEARFAAGALMALPIAVQELTMAAWLIINGFSKGGSERESDSV